MDNKFKDYFSAFNKIPILGMIHLAGKSPVNQAMREIFIFEEECIDGVIIENYHGSIDSVVKTLKEISRYKPNIAVGVNILPNEFQSAFAFAHEYNADFIQLDHVAGKYQSGELDFKDYSHYRATYPAITVIGGIWPKYYHPTPGSDLETDLRIGMERADAITVTGAGTGKETPIEKIRKFKEVLGDYPLVIGAGLNISNAYEQLSLADGAIIGSAFKENNDTNNKIDRNKVRDFMSIVKEIRNSEKN